MVDAILSINWDYVVTTGLCSYKCCEHTIIPILLPLTERGEISSELK